MVAPVIQALAGKTPLTPMNYKIIAAFLVITSIPTPVHAAENTDVCSQKPVVMVVDGVTDDRKQMAVYGQALKASGLHQNAGSYYLNDPRPLRILEGNRNQNHVTLLIKFPSECAALEFWKLPIYNQKIRPLRKGAGDYTVELYRLLE